MTFLTKTLAFALAVAATFAGCAAAATLALGSKSLAAGNAAVSSCGIAAPTATRKVDNSGNVTRMDLTGIPATCSGETLQVTLVGVANASLGNGSATIGSCTPTCSASITSFSAAVSAASVVSYSFGAAGS